MPSFLQVSRTTAGMERQVSNGGSGGIGELLSIASVDSGRADEPRIK